MGPQDIRSAPTVPKWASGTTYVLSSAGESAPVCPVITGLGIRSSGSNVRFPTNVTYTLGLSHFVGLYISSFMCP